MSHSTPSAAEGSDLVAEIRQLRTEAVEQLDELVELAARAVNDDQVAAEIAEHLADVRRTIRELDELAPRLACTGMPLPTGDSVGG